MQTPPEFTTELLDIEKISLAPQKHSPFYTKYTLIHYYQRRHELNDAIAYYKRLSAIVHRLLLGELTYRRDLCQRCISDIKDWEKRRQVFGEPLFVARKDNEEEMQVLKNVFGRQSIEHAFGPEGNGMEEILQKLAHEKGIDRNMR